eukprot:Skav224186  [mRNA]  locus=scaffold1975:325540:330201:- [translate_table: standard]
MLAGLHCTAYQETRITEYNKKHLCCKAADKGLQLQCGPTMRYSQNGKAEWGGVAFATTPGTSMLYSVNDDCTGNYASLLATNRALGMWVATDDGTTVLVFNLYLFSGAPSDPEKHGRNDAILQQTLEVIAQHGAIPAIIAADFQDIPHCYPSLRDAFAAGMWHDLLLQDDMENGLTRPTTFVRDKHWTTQEFSSSIDGILVNQHAKPFVQGVEVKHALGLQHAFVIASFEFGNQQDRQRGHVWHPHAAFDVSSLVPSSQRDMIAEQLWTSNYKDRCEAADNADDLMKLANEFSVQVLLDAGAKWKHGKQLRGVMPQLSFEPRKKTHSTDKDETTRDLTRLNKAMSRLDDLSFKIHNCNPGSHALSIAQTAWKRVATLLRHYEVDDIPDWPTQDHICMYWDFFDDLKQKTARKLRYHRIKMWRQRIAGSAMSNCKDIFQYLKRKNDLPQHHITTDCRGMPFYTPGRAIEFAREQWNAVFNVHETPTPSGPIMRVLGEKFNNIAKEVQLPAITEWDLMNAASERKREAVGGVDGWRTCEIQSLPWRCFTPWKMLWNKIESQEFHMPDIFKIAKLVMLPKPSAKSMQPIHKRLISLLNIHYLLWSRSRFMHLEQWQKEVLPDNIVGGRRFKRFLSMGEFIDDTALKNGNGVAQGDSASVLAVNILMSGWSLLMDRFDKVSAYIFIDDCYLYTELRNAQQLIHAVAATRLFDGLTGQELNISKSAGWGTSKEAKDWLQKHFPELPIHDMINILGSMVKSGKHVRVLDGSTIAYTIKTTVADIGRLPINLEKKAYLLAAKAVSKLLYAPELMPWPKLTLDSMVTNIARALWGSRPHWRSTELLFATCTNASVTHPYASIATRILRNLISRCRSDQVFARMWIQLCHEGKVIPRGLLDVFIRATSTLGIEFEPPFQFRFLGVKISFLELYPKQLRRMCRVASAQCLYRDAIRSDRKDLSSGGSGVMDCEITPVGTRYEPWRYVPGYDAAVTIGFAIVDDKGELIYRHGQHDPLASSYEAELLALVAAVRTRGPYIHFVTDCHTLKDTFDWIAAMGCVPVNVAFASWWEEIFQAAGFGDQCLLEIQWIRAHQFDNNNLLVNDLYLFNKRADFFAKEIAIEAAPIPPRMIKAWKQIVVVHQAWLCRLMKLISEQKDVQTVRTSDDIEEVDMIIEDNDLQLKNRFCNWEWNTPLDHFTWTPTNEEDPPPPRGWKFGNQFWYNSCTFFRSLRWRTNEGDRASVYQLAWQMTKYSPIIPPATNDSHAGTFMVFVDWVRLMIKELLNSEARLLPPGTKYDGRRIMYCNGYYPKGVILGSMPFMALEVRLSFARFISSHPYLGRTSGGWAVPLATIS